MEPSKKLYRSVSQKIIAGVCGGIGEYLNIDPVIIRLIFVALTVFGGSGILIYLIAMIIIPKSDGSRQSSDLSPPVFKFDKINSDQVFYFIGLILIGAGVIILLRKLSIFTAPFRLIGELSQLSEKLFFPSVLMLIGGLLLYSFFRSRRGGNESGDFTQYDPATHQHTKDYSANEAPNIPNKPLFSIQGQLYRSREDKKIFGICGGLARYFHIDSSIMRLLMILIAFATGFFFAVIGYFIMYFVVPEEPISKKSHSAQSAVENEERSQTDGQVSA